MLRGQVLLLGAGVSEGDSSIEAGAASIGKIPDCIQLLR